MQKFWYHSPVRFYKSENDLLDMTNPQNTQYFGGRNPYPLEISTLHRFLIPNYDNEVSTTDLSLWIDGVNIPCEFGISDGKLFRVTIFCDEFTQGNFEIRDGEGNKLFYSNCVQFVNSTDDLGRKHIRIATKHYYNRNLFAYAESQYDWMVTNLPAYDLGQFTIDSEYETQRTGGNDSLISADSFLDEVVTYQFLGNGDSNIFTFLQTHATNSSFYIDGTQRTIKEKPDVDEFSMQGIMKFVNVKDDLGLNILLDENEIFGDVLRKVLGIKGQSIIYVYDTDTVIPTDNG